MWGRLISFTGSMDSVHQTL